MRKRHSLISFGAGLGLMLIGATTALAQPAYAQFTSNGHGKPLAVLDTQLPTATPTSSVTGTPPTATSTHTGTPPTATPTVSPTLTATPTATRPTANPSAGGCWSIVDSPSMVYHGFYDVAAISSNDVWAVGVYVENGYRTLTEHWDGTSWSIVPSPNPGSLNQFFGVAAVAPNDVWAVGMSGTSDFSPALIEHWDGSTWSAVTSPVNGILREVTAISSNDVWAVGLTEPNGHTRGLVLHWNGSVWQHVPSPSPGVTSSLSGIAAAGPDDI